MKILFKTIFTFLTFVIFFIKVLIFIEFEVKLLKVRKNLFEQIKPQWDTIVSKNTCFQRILIRNKGKRSERFSMAKEYEIYEVSTI